ncbi:MAG: hypothetical protein US34_C0017G0015 [Candidatus Nomurabacteria bacterium GW2011_GWC2_36_9]|nr:MAG: hypothetical protein US21_C0004G0040 [Candidatus Nomurabacteria bacterium GW2011_GWB1_36_6]KKQ12381.1 MAG: hypothetical protein US26_C0009G0006 [Candidatus Nomurabacteria bacterium GW2011_GWE1_36_71]KKQ19788.1 MAG: hypothetical protein US34_C0017G0015 [Candidatus Nomurabacteria bacterium GW2011_GWC2_36_9]
MFLEFFILLVYNTSIIINFLYMDNKKKNIYTLVLVGGILMIVINVSLVLTGEDSLGRYLGVIAGMAFMISALINLKNIKKNNTQ